MKLVTFANPTPRVGIVDGSHVWDLRELYSWYLLDVERTAACEELAERLVPRDMALFIRINHARLGEFAAAVQRAKEAGVNVGRLPLGQTRLLAPVLSPSKIVCCGSSYREYLEGSGVPRADWPQDVKISFLKPPSALLGHRETIPFPPDAAQLDYENELAIVIGRTCSDVSEKDAGAYIFGFSVFNDSCVRDIPRWTGGGDAPRGKACDGFAPMGPWIVPSAYLDGDPNDLGFTTWVDGEIRQQSRTSRLMWTVEHAVAFISRYIRLLPGDVISTGSTLGNGHLLGKHLKQGQTVRCEIEGIGVLENIVGKRTWTSELQPIATA
jgi:acylpyruvate hydrolase